MNALTTVLLVVLVGAVGFGVWKFSQRQTSINVQLPSQPIPEKKSFIIGALEKFAGGVGEELAGRTASFLGSFFDDDDEIIDV